VKPERGRGGFTLIEMLVVIFIIGILFALLLPAIQSARARARQQQCVSNLANLGRALQAYESANRAFPPAKPVNRVAGPHNYSPHVFLLSYVGAQPLADKIDMRKQQYFAWDPTGQPLMKENVSVFVCPADGTWSAGRPGNSYRVCMGPGPYSICSSLTPCDQGIGGFRALYETTAADIRDGLSQTVAMSEKLIGSQSISSFDRQRDFWYTGVSALGTPLPPVQEMVELCSSLGGQPQYFDPYSGATWFLAGYEYTWYNHAVPPNSRVPDCAASPVFNPLNPDFETSGGVFGASSFHRRGVNCLFFDSHVSFMSNDVDLRLWRAISTRASGEAVSL
jgi:prepilin-type N-terminal cleavage/methylation domain-containing protein/prepilin-type processing-associated H-X9-DG protein